MPKDVPRRQRPDDLQGLRALLAREQTFLPLLTGEKTESLLRLDAAVPLRPSDPLVGPEELAVWCLWRAAEVVHGRSIQQDLIEIEERLIKVRLSLRSLPMNWAWIFDDFGRAWDAAPRGRGRGRRPGRELTRDLTALDTLIRSRQLSPRLVPVLAGERVRLGRLQESHRRAARRPRRKAEAVPPWPENQHLRASGLALRARGVSKAETCRLLQRLLTLLLPQFYRPDIDYTERLRALLTRPSR